MKRAHVRVQGSVQGVFFRVETRDRARSLGVSGWVRNLQDGAVEAVFEGAAHVYSGVTECAGQEHFYLETHCSLAHVDESGQVFVQSILDRDTLPGWDRMWADLQKEELRQALLKSSISGGSSSRSKVVKEEENVALASQV